MRFAFMVLAAAGGAGNDRLYENRHRKAEADQIVKPPSHPEILAMIKRIRILFSDRFFGLYLINPFFRFELQQGFQGSSRGSNPYNRHDLQGNVGVNVQFDCDELVSGVDEPRCLSGQFAGSAKLLTYLIHPCVLIH
tara:strand:- start:524 stop:934 length:411 start_codon:yes stop_codon:yes gene_type:complete